MTPRQLAQRIADDLFFDGFGNEAKRLVMEQERTLDGPGWCKAAVVDRIEQQLRQAKQEP